MVMTKQEQDKVDAMVGEIDKAPEPGDLKVGQEIESIGDLPKPIVDSITSAGYAYIYDTRTGDRSVTNRNMLSAQLAKKRADGSRVFTTVKPTLKASKVKHLCCRLHPDDPNRKHYEELGFPTCNKSNIPNPLQLARHMRRKHPVEWEAIEKERLDAEKQEEREFQRNLIKAATGQATASKKTWSRKKKVTTEVKDNAP